MKHHDQHVGRSAQPPAAPGDGSSHRLWRRWRFSLKAVLFILTILALAISWVARAFHGLAQQDQLASQIEAHGGKVSREPVSPSNPFSAASWLEFLDPRFSRQVTSVHAVAPQLHDIENLCWFPYLHSLQIEQSELDNSALETIARNDSLQSLQFAECRLHGRFTPLNRLTELISLVFHDCELASGTLSELESPNLKNLDLYKSTFSLADLSAVSRFDRLERLSLKGTQLTDVAIRHLEPMTSLVHLDLTDTDVTNEGLARLRDLKSLASLNISATKLTDTAVVNLQLELSALEVTIADVAQRSQRPDAGRLREMFELQCNGPFTTDATLRWLSTAQKLRSLGLHASRITDEGLTSLRTCTKLENLDLRDTSITETGLVHLRHLPSLQTIVGNELNDASLKAISRITTLTRLIVAGPTISDDGVASLANLTHLQYLSLAAPAARGDGFKSLAKLSELEYLFLGPMPLTRLAVDSLADLPALQVLELGGGQVEPGSLQGLATSRSLKTIDVGFTPASREDVLAFAEIPSLAYVTLREEVVPLEAARMLAAKRPDLQVWIHSAGQPARQVLATEN